VAGSSYSKQDAAQPALRHQVPRGSHNLATGYGRTTKQAVGICTIVQT
jgi:hypothetical protein